MLVNEECLQKVKEIENDVRRHIQLHKQMPTSFALTKRELKLVKEARRYGKIPTVVFKGKERPVNIKYSGYYG